MARLLLLALTLAPAVALVAKQLKPEVALAADVLENEESDKIPVCEIPKDFVRKVNPNAHRKPDAEELASPVFLDAPHLETVYYINLNKSNDRRIWMEQEVKKGFPDVKAERWSAIHKTQLKHVMEGHVHEYSDLGYGSFALPGIQAVYLSHYKLLQNISQHPDPNAVFIILEDDIHFKGEPGKMQDEVLCQISMLPPEWDMFKFGYWGFRMPSSVRKGPQTPYPGCAGEQMNPYTCHQEKFNFNYMGNQAYAVKPHGAKVLIEHLKRVPVSDIDGAMMPGPTYRKENKGKEPIWPNTYVSKQTLVGHWGFASVRGFKDAGAREQPLSEDYEGRREDEMQRLLKGETEISLLPEDEFL